MARPPARVRDEAAGGSQIPNPSALHILKASSPSPPTQRINWRKGVRIGSLKGWKVRLFIPGHATENPDGAAGEGMTVDAQGNVYAAEATVRSAAKYLQTVGGG